MSADGNLAWVKTRLGEEKLILRRMNGHEELGKPFGYELELLSEDEAIPLSDLVGQSVVIQVSLPDDAVRTFTAS